MILLHSGLFVYASNPSFDVELTALELFGPFVLVCHLMHLVVHLDPELQFCSSDVYINCILTHSRFKRNHIVTHWPFCYQYPFSFKCDMK